MLRKMGDEKKSTDRPIEAPKLTFVKGGTSTAASEKLYESRYREAEERRDQADADRAVARGQKKVKVEETGSELLLPGQPGGGVQYTNQFTENAQVPQGYLHFTYHDSKLNQVGEGYADLLIGTNPDDPRELMVVLVCRWCQADTHKHQQDNQIRITQSNKYFEFRPGVGPPTFELIDDASGLSEIYRSAGTIVESEPFTCPDCGTRMRIDMNRVIAD
jgi:hypothetical protein